MWTPILKENRTEFLEIILNWKFLNKKVEPRHLLLRSIFSQQQPLTYLSMVYRFN